MANDFFHNFVRLIKGTKARAESVNSLFDQLETGMDKLPTEVEFNTETRNYRSNTGPANSYAASIPHISTAYTIGQKVQILIDAADVNTSATTSLDISAIGAAPIKYPDGSNVAIGDLIGTCNFTYTGSVWHFTGISTISATNAANSAIAAAASESAAASSQSSASGSASAASASASAALTSEGNASTSETNAGNSETAAGISETNAGSSASSAGSSASAASTSEGNAGTSETNAGNSETAAALSEVNAGNSETAAGISESNASTSEGNALTSENNAATSAAQYLTDFPNITTPVASDSSELNRLVVTIPGLVETDKAVIADTAGNIRFPTGKGISDSNGSEILKTVTTPSAVNEITVTNSATGDAVQIAATGDDVDIGVTVAAKGAGALTLDGNVEITSNIVGEVSGVYHSLNKAIVVADGASLGTSNIITDATLVANKAKMVNLYFRARVTVITAGNSSFARIYVDNDILDFPVVACEAAAVKDTNDTANGEGRAVSTYAMQLNADGSFVYFDTASDAITAFDTRIEIIGYWK